MQITELSAKDFRVALLPDGEHAVLELDAKLPWRVAMEIALFAAQKARESKNETHG